MKGEFLATLCVAAVGATTGSAQVASSSTTATPVVAVARPTVENGATMLPANTEIWLTANEEINSKTIKQGGKFRMAVSRDVMMGNYIVVPHGTPADGQITYRTGKGAFGKSAKMEFDLADIDLNGRLIPVTGHYRVEGQGNTGAAVGAVVAAGVFGAFVTGHSAVIPQGAEYRAYTKEQLAFVAGGTTQMVEAKPAQPALQPTSLVATPGRPN